MTQRHGRGPGGQRRRGRTPPPRHSDRGGARRGGRARTHPPRPELPTEVPRLQRGLYQELRRTTPPGQLDDVVRAVGAAIEAVEEDPAEAVRLLSWAKSVASRSPALREALGVAAYRAEDYELAHRELLAYRRMSGRQDHNHLLADCARALGRPEKVGEYVSEMLTADVPAERLAEALIVQAGARADRGDLHGALAALEQADLNPRRVEPYHARLWYTAADLCEQLGQRARARELFAATAALDEDFLDVEERLAALEDEG